MCFVYLCYFAAKIAYMKATKKGMKKGITEKINRHFSYYLPIIFPLDFSFFTYPRYLYIFKALTNCNVYFVLVYAIHIHKKHMMPAKKCSQLTFDCSKSTIETPEEYVKYVRS